MKECNGSLYHFIIMQSDYIEKRNRYMINRSPKNVTELHKTGAMLLDFCYFDSLLFDCAYRCLKNDLYNSEFNFFKYKKVDDKIVN